MGISRVRVLPPIRSSNLAIIIVLIIGVELFCLVAGIFAGPLLFTRAAQKMTTKRSILLALMAYTVIAIWGFFLDSVIEVWFLAWLVACVQGGSQALSRSLYAGMIPSSRSGEFFGLFATMEKFASIVGPLVFAAVATVFNSSRPAVLSIVPFFVVGIVLLIRVNVDVGRGMVESEGERSINN